MCSNMIWISNIQPVALTYWLPVHVASKSFWCQEYFEYTPGVLRAYVKPKHLDALTFTLQPVIEAMHTGDCENVVS